MFNHIESPNFPPRTFRAMLADFGGTYFANAVIGFIFAATGPVAIILSVCIIEISVVSGSSSRGGEWQLARFTRPRCWL